MDEELAKEAALKEAIEAANKRMPTLEEATRKAKADVKAGRKGKKKEATRMLPSAVKTSCGVKATSVTTQMEKPKPKRCSACGDHHTGTDADGKVFYINRLSVCEMFRGKSPEEKASIVQLAGVCDLCLDWTKNHKAEDCQSKDEQGKMFEPCKQLMKNGAPCGDWHNSLLHGSTKKKPYKKPSAEEEQAQKAALRAAIEAAGGVVIDDKAG